MPVLRPDALLSELDAAQLDALRLAAADLGRPLTDWPHVPALRQFVVLVAGTRRVRRLMALENIGRTAATLGAALQLGLNEKSLDAALRRAGVRFPANRGFSPRESAYVSPTLNGDHHDEATVADPANEPGRSVA